MIKNMEFKNFILNLVEVFAKYNMMSWNDIDNCDDKDDEYITNNDLINDINELFESVKYQNPEDIIKCLNEGLDEFPTWFIFDYMRKNTTKKETYRYLYQMINDELKKIDLINIIKTANKPNFISFGLNDDSNKINRICRDDVYYYLIVGETNKHYKAHKLIKKKIDKLCYYWVKDQYDNKVNHIDKEDIRIYDFDFNIQIFIN